MVAYWSYCCILWFHCGKANKLKPQRLQERNVRICPLDLAGKIILWLSEIALFSVFSNTMAYEKKCFISISHQFDMYTTFAIHVTTFYDSKARNFVYISCNTNCIYLFMVLAGTTLSSNVIFLDIGQKID